MFENYSTAHTHIYIPILLITCYLIKSPQLHCIHISVIMVVAYSSLETGYISFPIQGPTQMPMLDIISDASLAVHAGNVLICYSSISKFFFLFFFHLVKNIYAVVEPHRRRVYNSKNITEFCRSTLIYLIVKQTLKLTILAKLRFSSIFIRFF